MRPRILSTLDTWSDIPGFGDRVDSVRLSARSTDEGGGLLFACGEVWRGIRLWWLSRRYEAVVTDCSPHVAVFGLLERLRLGSRRRHLLFECYCSYQPGPVARLVKALQYRAALTPRSRAVVYARRERTRFSRYFGIPMSRFVFIPYHTTLRHFEPSRQAPPRAQPYLFAGGDTHRDYRTLCQAVAGLDIPVVIALRDRRLLKGMPIPENVEVLTTDDEGFRRWMLHACINVVPLQADTLRSAGQQTFLNAMALGTAVVVTDVDGGKDYIQDGINGVLVEAGDPAALRAVLQRLLRDPQRVGQLAANAARTAPRYSTERILGLCLDYLLSDAFTDATCAEFPKPPATEPKARRLRPARLAS